MKSLIKDNANAQELRLDGSWEQVFCLRGSKQGGWCTSAFVVKGNKFETRIGKPVSGDLVVGTNEDRKTLDLKFDNNSGPYSGDLVKGIYQFAMTDILDVLIVNFGLGGAENDFLPRPTSFDSSDKSSLVIFVRKE